MIRCFLSLGSNLHHPYRQLHQALLALRRLPNSYLKSVATFYPNKAVGRKTQPLFVNTVVELYTKLPPARLLKMCQHIELQQQRLRLVRWGPRTLDIDILFYGHQVINTHKLTIPHPRYLDRDFVLTPLKELMPNLDLSSRINYT